MKIKQKLIYFITISLVAIAMAVVSLVCNYGEESSSYILGFSVGLLAVSLIKIIQTIIVINDKEKLKKIEIAEKDERNIKIINNSYALTFRIGILVEAICCIVATAINQIDISYILGMVISAQLLVFVITYVIISKKI